MRKYNPFSVKEEREFFEENIVKPYDQVDKNELDRMLKRAFFKNVAQMVIGTAIGLAIRHYITKKIVQK